MESARSFPPLTCVLRKRVCKHQLTQLRWIMLRLHPEKANQLGDDAALVSQASKRALHCLFGYQKLRGAILRTGAAQTRTKTREASAVFAESKKSDAKADTIEKDTIEKDTSETDTSETMLHSSATDNAIETSPRFSAKEDASETISQSLEIRDDCCADNNIGNNNSIRLNRKRKSDAL